MKTTAPRWLSFSFAALAGCAGELAVIPDDVPAAAIDSAAVDSAAVDSTAVDSPARDLPPLDVTRADTALDVAALDAAAPDVGATPDVVAPLDVATAPDVPAACLPATQPCTGAGCCAGLSCGTTTLGRVCCGGVGTACHTENGEDCCGDLECVAGQCAAPAACLAAVRPCAGGTCCAGLVCGDTTAGHVCCGNAGATCATSNGEDCCGALECVSGHCVGATACIGSTGACTGSGCCAGLSCGTTTLGRVCCGNAGASCHTSNGEDCCGALECVAGRCGTTATGGSCGPSLVYYPVRALHNNGYDATAGDSSQWTCNDAHSNSDFVGGGRHLGNDIWAAPGSPVVAAVSGTLRYVAYSSYSGNQATIVDDCGWYHFFCHMQGFAPGIGPAANGTRVTAGRLIGYVGNTGTASNGVIHLHYSIYPHDNYDAGIDPYPYLHAVESNVCHLP